MRSKGFRRHFPAVNVQYHQPASSRHGLQNTPAFIANNPLHIRVLAALDQWHFNGGELHLTGQAFLEIVTGLYNPCRHFLADRNQIDMHRLLGFLLPGKVDLPKVFKVIEITYLWLHHMHHNIGEIDQHPLAFGLAFNTQRGMP